MSTMIIISLTIISTKAIAGGMMVAASYSLVMEGVGFDEQELISRKLMFLIF